MRSILALNLFTLLLLSSCGAYNNIPTVSDDIQGATGDFGFSFEGVDEEGQDCSTGEKSFENLQQFCVGLQKPEKKNCAFTQRAALFQEKCAPRGYTFYESLKCNLKLIHPETELNADGSVPREQLASSVNFCTGNLESGTVVTSKSRSQQQIINRFHIDFSSKFIPSNLETEEKSFLNISLYNLELSGERNYAFRDFLFTGLSANQRGKATEDYDYLLACARTWGCPVSEETTF